MEPNPMFLCVVSPHHVLGTADTLTQTPPATGESVRLMTASPRIVRRFDRLWWQLQQGQSLVTGVIKLRPMLGGINIQKKVTGMFTVSIQSSGMRVFILTIFLLSSEKGPWPP